ncbi:class I SAM-dependent methyltransferase [Streptosporangium lutulentum]
MHSVVNTEQAEAWNGYEGNHWADHQDRYDAVNSGFNDHLLAAADLGEQDRVLDIGCGNGQVTRLAARRARLGHSTGIDLSGPMLQRARATAADEGVSNVTFARGDAQIHPFPAAGFDVAVSRFGIMFFADPVAAFANIGRALRPGAVSPCCPCAPWPRTTWEPSSRRWPSTCPRIPCGPTPTGRPSGPESLADPDRIHEVLTDAGYEKVASAPVEAAQVWGRDAADAARFLYAWGPVRHMLGKVDQTSAARARDALTAALRPYEGHDAVRLRGAARLITATRP